MTIFFGDNLSSKEFRDSFLKSNINTTRILFAEGALPELSILKNIDAFESGFGNKVYIAFATEFEYKSIMRNAESGIIDGTDYLLRYALSSLTTAID